MFAWELDVMYMSFTFAQALGMKQCAANRVKTTKIEKGYFVIKLTSANKLQGTDFARVYNEQ